VVGTPDVEHLYLCISAQADSGEQPTVTYCDKEQVGAQISAAHTVICIQQQAAPPFIVASDTVPLLIANCMQLAYAELSGNLILVPVDIRFVTPKNKNPLA
jgi:hypothetical protein